MEGFKEEGVGGINLIKLTNEKENFRGFVMHELREEVSLCKSVLSPEVCCNISSHLTCISSSLFGLQEEHKER